MEQVKNTVQNKNVNINTILIGLIVVLAVLLVIVLVVAFGMGSGQEDTKPSENTEDISVAGTEGTTATQPEIGLTVTSPASAQLVSLEKTLTLTGMSDPAQPLTVNGAEVAREEDGSFSCPVELTVGMNEIVIFHKGETVTYQVEYRYAVETFLPAGDVSYNSGATIQLAISVRKGSKVQAELGGTTITMKEDPNQLGTGVAEGFVLYSGTYKLTNTNTTDLDLGQIKYTVTCDDVTETYSSGTITCLKAADILASDPGVTPDYGDYVDVGSGYIVEIITDSAETFAGATTDDKSSPTRNYLPKGTVDYCSTTTIPSGTQTTILMRCGRRVYIQKSNYPSGTKTQVTDRYKGTLPDHNEIGIASVTQSGAYTILTFDTMWKAPFYFDLLPQTYNDPGEQDYRITSLTATYIDITFCYATIFEGTVQIPADNPLFSRAELTRNKSDCTLRLYLKKTGGFYGWDAYYNESGQLCFQFLNPAKVSAATNAYGVDLTGVRIMLDVGHGGLDGGAVARDADGNEVDEAELNLLLAEVLKEELESMGATVIMNRTDDSAVNIEERIRFLKEQAPDLCLAVHQNSIVGYPNHSGCEVCYATPFSQLAAKYIYQETLNSGIYKKTTLDWHYYFVARETVCPVVLLENGYMSNAGDLANMADTEVLTQKAQAIARGVAQYFLDIQ